MAKVIGQTNAQSIPMEKLRGLCFKCLQKGHVAKDCQRQRSCAHCGKSNHHIQTVLEKPAESGLQAITTKGEVDNAKAEEANVVSGSHGLMQTATATVTGTQGNQSMSIRMVVVKELT